MLRGAPNVSEGRRRAVLEAAAELGYRPNLVARALVERRTRTLGVLVSDLHNPFFAEVIDGLQAEALGRGLRAVLGTGRRDPAEEADAVEAFLQQHVDALILLSPRIERRVLAAAARTAPTVVLGAREPRAPRCDAVVADDAHGAELAVAHLADLGHARIAHLAAPEPAAADRRAGYERAMARHGLAAHVTVVEGDFTDEGGYAGARALLAHGAPPTAIFACNDLAALGALTALGEAGLRVPEDVSLVGYDNTALAAIRPLSLTSVDQPRLEMGRLAVELVEARRERPNAPARIRELTPTLRVRGSTAPPPQPARNSAATLAASTA